MNQKTYSTQREAKIAAMKELRATRTRLRAIYKNSPKSENITELLWLSYLLGAIRNVDETYKNIKSTIK